jgi:hypothetical protein
VEAGGWTAQGAGGWPDGSATDGLTIVVAGGPMAWHNGVGAAGMGGYRAAGTVAVRGIQNGGASAGGHQGGRRPGGRQCRWPAGRCGGM